jgi:tRNA(adenine34) deaminase
MRELMIGLRSLAFREGISLLEDIRPVVDRTDELWMRKALTEARAAEEAGEVPVGAIVVHQGSVIGRGYNQREVLRDPTAHAEMIAITAAAQAMNSWRLTGCTLYVTLEPCLMCAGAIVQARIERVVFGAEDSKAGACVSLYQATTDERLNHRVSLLGGVLAGACGAVLSDFFRAQRTMGKK